MMRPAHGLAVPALLAAVGHAATSGSFHLDQGALEELLAGEKVLVLVQGVNSIATSMALIGEGIIAAGSGQTRFITCEYRTDVLQGGPSDPG
jgi:hypothetical protein